jgi:hypothetical protein
VSRFKGLIVDLGGVLTNPLHGVMRDFAPAVGLAPEALVELFSRDSQSRAAFADVERRARKARGLSQRALASGEFSSGHLANVENGLVTPSTALLEHYAATCGGNYALLERKHSPVG